MLYWQGRQGKNIHASSPSSSLALMLVCTKKSALLYAVSKNPFTKCLHTRGWTDDTSNVKKVPTRVRARARAHTHTQICNIYCFSTATIICERASTLPYTDIVCLGYFNIIYPVHFDWIKFFILNTNKCTCIIYKCSLTSLLPVYASFKPFEGTPHQNLKLTKIDYKSSSRSVTFFLQPSLAMYVL